MGRNCATRANGARPAPVEVKRMRVARGEASREYGRERVFPTRQELRSKPKAENRERALRRRARQRAEAEELRQRLAAAAAAARQVGYPEPRSNVGARKPASCLAKESSPATSGPRPLSLAAKRLRADSPDREVAVATLPGASSETQAQALVQRTESGHAASRKSPSEPPSKARRLEEQGEKKQRLPPVAEEEEETALLMEAYAAGPCHELDDHGNAEDSATWLVRPPPDCPRFVDPAPLATGAEIKEAEAPRLVSCSREREPQYSSAAQLTIAGLMYRLDWRRVVQAFGQDGPSLGRGDREERLRPIESAGSAGSTSSTGSAAASSGPVATKARGSLGQSTPSLLDTRGSAAATTTYPLDWSGCRQPRHPEAPGTEYSVYSVDPSVYWRTETKAMTAQALLAHDPRQPISPALFAPRYPSFAEQQELDLQRTRRALRTRLAQLPQPCK